MSRLGNELMLLFCRCDFERLVVKPLTGWLTRWLTGWLQKRNRLSQFRDFGCAPVRKILRGWQIIFNQINQSFVQCGIGEWVADMQFIWSVGLVSYFSITSLKKWASLT
jgi:hypothetical protein